MYPTTQRSISEDVKCWTYISTSVRRFLSSPRPYMSLTTSTHTHAITAGRLLTVSACCLWAPLLLHPNCWAAAPVGPTCPWLLPHTHSHHYSRPSPYRVCMLSVGPCPAPSKLLGSSTCRPGGALVCWIRHRPAENNKTRVSDNWQHSLLNPLGPEMNMNVYS